MILDDLALRVSRLEVAIAELKAGGGASPKPPPPTEGVVATDYDLDCEWGNEDIRKDIKEKYWAGESQIGRRMSECPAEFLDGYARYKDASAHMNEKSGDADRAKYIGYDRKSAARARGWAARIRAGKPLPIPRAVAAPAPPPADDDFPFGDNAAGF